MKVEGSSQATCGKRKLLKDGAFDAFDVYAAEVPEFGYGAMLYEAVGQAESLHGHAQSVVCEPFEDSRAEASVAYAVLNGYYTPTTRGRLGEEEVVEGLEVAHIVVGNGEFRVFVAKLLDSFHHRDPYSTEREHCDVGALLEASSSAYGQGVHGTLPVGL